MLKNWPRNTNQTYGPTDKGKFYLPKPDHNANSTNKRKHKWEINENQEFSVFLLAESPKNELYCFENECYFSLVDKGNFVLGTKGERIAKFPRPINDSDAWHGYPVHCDHSHNIPSDDLLDLMVDENVINETTRKRIERKKL